MAARDAHCLGGGAYGRGSASLCLLFASVSSQVCGGQRKGELEMPRSSQVQGIAQAAPDEQLGRAFFSFSLGSVPERGHQAPQTLGLSRGACCALLLAIKTHPPVFPDLLMLLINICEWYVEKSQKGVGLMS